MMIPHSDFVGVALFVGGVIATLLLQKFFVLQQNGAKSSDKPLIEAGASPPSNESRQIQQLIQAIEQLTFQMNEQVGVHSTRVGQITHTLQSSPADASFLLYSGKMLVEANEKLQADLQEAKAEISRQRALIDEYLHESLTDMLTSIPNRRAWDREIVRLFKAWEQNSLSLCVLMIDIDHFKKVNDVYGHMVGDQLLKSFSQMLISIVRETDFIARIGGEEFAIAMPITPFDEAISVAERARASIERHEFIAGKLSLKITVSIGLKQAQGAKTVAELMERVDQALYAAKTHGRNRCYVFRDAGCHRIKILDQRNQRRLSVEDLEDWANPLLVAPHHDDE